MSSGNGRTPQPFGRQFCSTLSGCVFINISDEGVCAKGRETFRQRVTDQTSSTGHNRNTAIQIEHIFHV